MTVVLFKKDNNFAPVSFLEIFQLEIIRGWCRANWMCVSLGMKSEIEWAQSQIQYRKPSNVRGGDEENQMKNSTAKFTLIFGLGSTLLWDPQSGFFVVVVRNNKKWKIKCNKCFAIYELMLCHTEPSSNRKKRQRSGKKKKLKTTNTFLRLSCGVVKSTRCRRLTCNTRMNKMNQSITYKCQQHSHSMFHAPFEKRTKNKKKESFSFALFRCETVHFKQTMAIHIFHGTICILFNSIPLSRQSTCRVGFCFFFLYAHIQSFTFLLLWLVLAIDIYLYNVRHNIYKHDWPNHHRVRTRRFHHTSTNPIIHYSNFVC